MAGAASGTIESRGVRAVRAALAGDAPVIVVRAPLGYGKSTAVAAATAAAGDVAWYTAEAWDREAPLAPLIERLRDVRPDAGRATLTLATEGAPPERLGATLAAELAHVGTPLVVVVDDAHHLDEGPFPALAGTLVRRLPRSVRLVVVTRTQPWAPLVEALAAGRAHAIDVDALRFDDDDARALAGDRGPSLAATADGWPLAVALAARTGAPSVPSALVGDVLAERLLRALPPAHVDALVDTAVYDTVDPRVLDPHGERGLATVFAALVAEGAMVAPSPNGYRVHPLLRATLVPLRAQRDGGLRAAHTGAARVLAGAHRHRAALYHLGAASDPAADEVYLRAHADAAVADGAVADVRAAAGRVRAARPGAPVIPYIEALVAKARGDDPRERFAAAARGDDDELAFRARLELVEIALGRGVPVEAAEIDELLALSRRFGPAAEARTTIRAAWADALANRFTAALERLDALPDDGSLAIAIDAAPLAAYALTVLGAFDAAQERLDVALDRLVQTDAVVATAAGLVWSARFALLRGATAQAYAEAREAARTGAPFDLRSHAAAMHITLAEAALHAGDTAAARSAAAAARTAAARAWYAYDAERIAARARRLAARASVLERDPAAARAAAEQIGGPPVERVAALADAAVAATVARASDAAAARARAAAAFDGVTAIDALDAVTLHEAALLLVLAGGPLAAYDCGSFAALIDARADAGVAARVAAKRGELGGLLAAVTAGGPAYAAAVAPLVGAAETPARDAAGTSLEPLTARESEILALLAAGLTNKEIAQRLIVGVRTVETHVARIAGKLGVNSRARAVAKAVSLGIVAVP